VNRKNNYYSYTAHEVALYDEWFSDVGRDEIEFYAYFLEQLPGAALEIGCGTGRLLIPLIKRGFIVDGLDNSSSMLERCKEKAVCESLSITLYEQSMQSLALQKRYATIYVPSCSYMLITQIHDAEETLRRFYEQLQTGGQLLLSFFLPFSAQISPGVWQLRHERMRDCDAVRMIASCAVTYQPFEQIMKEVYRYEVYKEGTLSRAYLTTRFMRWYSYRELVMMLQEAGFTKIICYGDYSFEKAADYHETYIIHAYR
jgi:ubiquinone/menaquinone biosynthesis C-methylase UbiE